MPGLRVNICMLSHPGSGQVTCELRTAAEVIRSHDIDRIDLLKVDVEGAEELLLQGLDGGDWPKVQVRSRRGRHSDSRMLSHPGYWQAAVIEVHDIDGRLDRIQVSRRRCVIL